MTWTGDPQAFSCLPVEDAAAGLTDVLRAERADVLTVYDAAGGYGHPDHRQVHAAGWFAARAARTPSVLEATADAGGTDALRLLLRLPTPLFDLVARREWFVDRDRARGRCDDVFAGCADPALADQAHEAPRADYRPVGLRSAPR